jgi:hypothetical protein
MSNCVTLIGEGNKQPVMTVDWMEETGHENVREETN